MDELLPCGCPAGRVHSKSMCDKELPSAVRSIELTEEQKIALTLSPRGAAVFRQMCDDAIAAHRRDIGIANGYRIVMSLNIFLAAALVVATVANVVAGYLLAASVTSIGVIPQVIMAVINYNSWRSKL